jgi:hypothetical protein
VTLNPSSGPPGTPFQLQVTNTGQGQDTFDLALGGPAALVATLGSRKVTLAAGASMMVPVSTTAVNFASPGALPLTGFATSETNAGVTDNDTANLTIAGAPGLAADFSPASQVLPIPGTSDFLLEVHNTGNQLDSYTATITGTNGPVTASLVNPETGQPTQTTPVFKVPGLATGVIMLHADLAQFGQGTVTVTVQSQSDPSMMSSPTATVSAAMPGTIAFSAATYSGSETGGGATITLTRTGGGGEVSVQVTTSDGTATAGQDYTAVNQTVTWADGDTSPKTITVPIAQDTLTEGNETVNLALSGPTGGATVGTPANAVLTIADAPGTIQFALLPGPVFEDGGTAFVIVTRTGGNGGAVSALVTTSDGTATAGRDYTSVSQMVSWADGDTSDKRITIPLLNDGAADGVETVNASLSGPTGGAALGIPSQTAVSITDTTTITTPRPGTVQFSAAGYTVNEEAGTAAVTLTRTGGSSGPVAVLLSTMDGSAKAGEDYAPVSQMVAWADGDTSPKTVVIPIVDDNLAGESNQTVLLTLSSPSGGASLGGPASGVLTIVEDQEPAPPPKLSQIKAIEHTSVKLTLTGSGFTKQSYVLMRGHVKGRSFAIRLKTKFLSSTRVQAKVPKFLPSPFGGATVEENNELTFSVVTPGGVETASQRFEVLEEVRPGSAGTPREQAAVVAYENLHNGHEYFLKQIPKSFLKQFFATFSG